MTATPGITHGRRIVWVSAALLSASFVGRLPQAMGALAIVWLVLSTGGDYGYASALTALYVVAGTIGQPLWGRIVDRTGTPVPVIAGTAVVAGGALCVLAMSPGLLLVAGAAVVVAGLATPPLEPVLRSLWPRLVPAGPQLTRAFAADAAVQEVLFIAGPLVAALAVGWGGPAVAVVAMAVLGVLGAAAFVAQRPLRLLQGERGVDRPAAGASRRGTVLRSGALRRIIGALILAGLSIGVLTISAATFAGVHGAAGGVGAGGSSLAGVALAANAAGALLGAVLVARFPPKVEARRLLSPLLIVLGVLYLPTAALGLDPILWLGFAALSGVALPPLLTQVFVLTERVAPPEQLVEANAWVVSAFNIGIAAGTLGAGVLVEAFSGHAGGSSELGSVVAVLAAGACAVVAATMVRARAFPA